MSVNKGAVIRYQVLDKCFRNTGRKYFFDDLLASCNQVLEDHYGRDFKIKRRQLFDDISFMESEAGYKANISRVREGRKKYYRYEDPSFSINNQPLNETEANYLTTGLAVMSRFAGLPQFEWMQEVVPIIENKLGIVSQSKPIISYDSNIDLKGIEYLKPLFNAISNENSLSVEYKSFKTAKAEKFVFHPQYLKQYNNRWFCLGLREDKEPIINIALDRIIDITDSKVPYKMRGIDWEEDYFYDIIGVSRPWDGNVEEVVLLFNKEQAPYILTKPIHPTQKAKQVEDKLKVSIRVIPNFELTRLILSFGSKVSVLEPDSLKQEWQNEVRLMYDYI